MTHAQYLDYFYYLTLMAAVVHVVLIAAETSAYRITRIKSLIPMVISNVVGLAYLAMLCFRQIYATPVSVLPLVLTSGALYTAEVVVGVWATVVFLHTVKNISIPKGAT
jgi:hypothetical protein